MSLLIWSFFMVSAVPSPQLKREVPWENQNKQLLREVPWKNKTNSCCLKSHGKNQNKQLKAQVPFPVHSSIRLHTISTVRAHRIVTVDFSRYDADVQVMPWAFFLMGTLTEGAGVDLVSCRPLIVFAYAEKSAGLFSLALYFLQEKVK